MRCPYCTSEIDDAALACPHCTRDLYLFKPLLARIGELEARIGVLEAGAASAPTVRGTAVDTTLDAVATIIPDDPVSPRISELLKRVALPVLLLGCAHVLLTVIYDANTIYLRIVSLLIPLPFGFLFTAHVCRRASVVMFVALAASFAAVLGMSVVTALVDQVPVLPEGLREWREFLEYAVSIAFSYATGCILGNMSRRRGRFLLQQGAMGASLAHIVSSGVENTQRIHKVVTKFNDMGGALTAAATTAASIYMGLQGLIK